MARRVWDISKIQSVQLKIKSTTKQPLVGTIKKRGFIFFYSSPQQELVILSIYYARKSDYI
jgi:hypothetical protein